MHEKYTIVFEVNSGDLLFKKLRCFNILEHGPEAAQGLDSFSSGALSGKFKYLFKFEQG